MEADVETLLEAVPEQRREDTRRLAGLITAVTGEVPRVRTGSVIGFGSRHYRYTSGREGDTVRVGFAPRRSALVLYVTGYLDGYRDLLDRLGPHRAGKGCLYLTDPSAVDEAVLREIVARSYAEGASSD